MHIGNSLVKETNTVWYQNSDYSHSSLSVLIVALISAVLLAILTYETYEKWYLKLSSTSIGVIVVILFLLNVNSINKYKLTERNFASFDNITNDMTVEDIVRMNHRWTVNDPKNIFAPSCVYESGNGPLGWCRHTGLNETGKYKMAMIGNSWTANHAKVFYQECGNKAKSILQGSAIGCEPLYPSEQIEMCKSFFTEFEKRIREEKPDYAFIVTRYISIGEPFAKGVTSFENDPIYQTMKEQMFKFISNIKYKLYILDSIPRIFYNGITSLPALLEKKTDPASIDKMLILPHQYEMARKRHAQLLKDCGEKCEMIDYAPVFLNKTTNTFRYYDERGLSYYTKYLHLTPLGIEHIRHVWTDVCAKL
uniref:SGNH domain-containing protein n=1 Tax=Caenorhabditis tropicalis TaxID=1561998 RepID=A0A1I7U2X1_9PELO